MTDFHDYEGRLAEYLQRLEREKFSKQDRILIRDYIHHCRAQNISMGRLFKIAWTLISTRRLLRTDFEKANRRDIEQLIGDINSSPKYSPDTKSDFKKILKKFYKYVRHGNADKLTAYPPEVAWIQTGIKRNEVKEPDLISENEAKRMIEAAPSSIDKAMIALLYEGGFRISEALGMRLRDLTFDGAGARASVHGKTGPRVVRLITSAPLLAQYAQQHPMKDDENAALWYYFPTLKTFKDMNYRTASIIVKRAAVRAGLKKRIYPHLFRHSAATRDSSYGLNERILEIKYGWVKSSKMAGRYTHIQDEQVVDNALLSVYAKQQIKQPDPTRSSEMSKVRSDEYSRSPLLWTVRLSPEQGRARKSRCRTGGDETEGERTRKH